MAKYPYCIASAGEVRSKGSPRLYFFVPEAQENAPGTDSAEQETLKLDRRAAEKHFSGVKSSYDCILIVFLAEFLSCRLVRVSSIVLLRYAALCGIALM